MKKKETCGWFIGWSENIRVFCDGPMGHEGNHSPHYRLTENEMRKEINELKEENARLESLHREYPILVVAAIIVKEGKVLLEYRESTKKWDLPGGKVECGETPEAAIVREIREELHVTVVPARLIPTIKPASSETYNWLILAYHCILSGKGPQTNEHLRWWSLGEISKNATKILPADFAIINSVW